MGNYPADWDQRRFATYRRDNYACQECGDKVGSGGKSKPYAHHKIPISKGGSHELSNLETLCGDCHEEKPGHEMLKKGNKERKRRAKIRNQFRSEFVRNIYGIPYFSIKKSRKHKFKSQFMKNYERNKKKTG